MKHELLAPAGNLEVAITALEAGADAVYAGFGKFNAREMNDNFAYEDMAKLSEYTKKHGKKFYLTFNTLIKQSEIKEVGNLLEKAAMLEPDAYIVQDMGMVKLIRDFLPKAEIHASTQLGIHNTSGIKLAKSLGISRIILERQINLTELGQITKNSELPIEAFVHGALCSCLSCSCLFSSYLGGYSGNRGKCKQPCRRRYFGVGKNKGNGFFYSAQDLYTLDLIPQLKRQGVMSFKIEGRLKRSDYVKQAVKAYRMMIDCEEGFEEETLKRAKAALAGTYGRKWSHGFYDDKSTKELIVHDSPGSSGLPVGKIIDVKESGFTVKLIRNIYKGDRVRVQAISGDDTPGFTVTLMKKYKKECVKGAKGDEVFLKTSREAERGAMLYKTGMQSEISSRLLANLPEFVPSIYTEYKLVLRETGLAIYVTTPNEKKTFKYDFEPETAKTNPVTGEYLEKLFSTAVVPGLKTSIVTAEVSGDYFVPVSMLKKIRREFVEFVGELDLSKSEELIGVGDKVGKAIKEIAALKVESEELQKDAVLMFNGGDNSLKNISAKKIALMSEIKEDTDEVMLPFFCVESDLKKLKTDIDDIYNKGIRKFRATSFFHFDILKKYEDIEISTSYPLAVTNSFAADEYRKLGAVKQQVWIELEKEAIEDCVRTFPVQVETYFYGRPSLLSTRAHIVAPERIADARGNAFRTKFDTTTGLSMVFPEKVILIGDVEGATKFYDLSMAKLGESNSSTFNFNYVLN